MPGTPRPSARDVLRRGERAVRSTTRRSELAWRYGINLRPTLAYRRHDRARPAPSAEVDRIVADLDRDGVALSSLDALVGPDAGRQLLAAADRVRSDRSAEVDESRRALASPDTTTQKPFVVGLLGSRPTVDPTSDLAAFALDPALLDVAHRYYGMFVALRYYDIWHTLVTDAPPSQSQLWHRDPEDRLILKVFVALEDIDEGSGPFSYAPGTHAKGPVRRRPEATHVDGSTPRSNDEQMHAVVARDRWRTATGPRGTVVFADTRGFHRGGHAREHERVVFVCQYLSRGAGRGGVPTGPR